MVDIKSKTFKLNESIAINKNLIIEKGEEAVILSPLEYQLFLKENKSKIKINKNKIKEEGGDLIPDNAPETPMEPSKEVDTVSNTEIIPIASPEGDVVTNPENTNPDVVIQEKEEDDKKDDKKDDSEVIDESVEKVMEQETMTTGQALMDQLGLTELDHVYICKIGVPFQMYHIVFDSYKSTLPLTKNSIAIKGNTEIMFKGNMGLNKTPYIPLERWNGNPDQGLFIINDIAGNQYSKWN